MAVFQNPGEVYRLLRATVEVQRERKQTVAGRKWNLEQAAGKFIRELQEVTPSWAKDAYAIETSGSGDLAIIDIYNVSAPFGVLLHGSATKNVDNPGSPYPIFPVNGDLLVLKGAKGKFPVGDPIGPFGAVQWKNMMNSSPLWKGVNQGKGENSQFGWKRNTRDLKPRELRGGDVGVIVAFVTSHPGRDPHWPLRNAILRGASDPRMFTEAISDSMSEIFAGLAATSSQATRTIHPEGTMAGEMNWETGEPFALTTPPITVQGQIGDGSGTVANIGALRSPRSPNQFKSPMGDAADKFKQARGDK